MAQDTGYTMTEYRNDTPRRDLKKQAISVDMVDMVATYARACTASAEYIIVRVPIEIDPLTLDKDFDLRALEDWQKRFVTDNITPREYAVKQGEAPEQFDRSR